MKEFCRLLPRVNWAYLVVVARPFSALGMSLRVCLCVGDTVIFFFFFKIYQTQGHKCQFSGDLMAEAERN